MRSLVHAAPRYLFTVLVLILTAMVCTSCDKQEIIAHDLVEREANEILVYLSGQGIEAKKVKQETSGGGGGGAALWNISVSAGKKREAMAVLSRAGLPRRQGQSLLQLFKESGLVPSEMQQTIRYQAGLSEQIASVIRKIDGVIDADIQLSFPKEDPLNPEAEKGKVTASVYVKHNGVLNDPNSFLIQKIKELVAGAVPDLGFDNVTVVPDLARLRDIDILTGTDDLKSGDISLVSIWTLIIAKESVTRFRIIFFSFFVAILLLVFAIIWLLWKILPALSSLGGMSALLSMSPLRPAAPEPLEEKKTKKKKEEDEDEDEEEDDDLEDEDEEDEE